MHLEVLHVILRVKHGLGCKLSSHNTVGVRNRSHGRPRTIHHVDRIPVDITVDDTSVRLIVRWTRQYNGDDVVQPEILGVNPIRGTSQGLGLYSIFRHKH